MSRPEYKCAQCYIEGKKDPTKGWEDESFMLIYDGESLCPHHFDLKRARLIPDRPEVTE